MGNLSVTQRLGWLGGGSVEKSLGRKIAGERVLKLPKSEKSQTKNDGSLVIRIFPYADLPSKRTYKCTDVSLNRTTIGMNVCYTIFLSEFPKKL